MEIIDKETPQKPFVAITDKIAITMNEAIELSGVGRHTLTRIAAENPDLVLMVGKKKLFKRKALIDFLLAQRRI